MSGLQLPHPAMHLWNTRFLDQVMAQHLNLPRTLQVVTCSSSEGMSTAPARKFHNPATHATPENNVQSLQFVLGRVEC